jgi:hypothetical protein
LRNGLTRGLGDQTTSVGRGNGIHFLEYKERSLILAKISPKERGLTCRTQQTTRLEASTKEAPAALHRNDLDRRLLERDWLGSQSSNPSSSTALSKPTRKERRPFSSARWRSLPLKFFNLACSASRTPFGLMVKIHSPNRLLPPIEAAGRMKDVLYLTDTSPLISSTPIRKLHSFWRAESLLKPGVSTENKRNFLLFSVSTLNDPCAARRQQKKQKLDAAFLTYAKLNVTLFDIVTTLKESQRL